MWFTNINVRKFKLLGYKSHLYIGQNSGESAWLSAKKVDKMLDHLWHFLGSISRLIICIWWGNVRYYRRVSKKNTWLPGQKVKKVKISVCIIFAIWGNIDFLGIFTQNCANKGTFSKRFKSLRILKTNYRLSGIKVKKVPCIIFVIWANIGFFG